MKQEGLEASVMLVLIMFIFLALPTAILALNVFSNVPLDLNYKAIVICLLISMVCGAIIAYRLLSLHEKVWHYRRKIAEVLAGHVNPSLEHFKYRKHT